MTDRATGRLALGLHLGTVRDLPVTSAVAGLDGTALYSAVRDAGYVVVQDGDDTLAEAAGLRRSGSGRVLAVGDAGRIARDALVRGHGSVTLHVGTGFEDDDAAAALIGDVVTTAADTGIGLFVETHRATVTQDPWRTLRLVEAFPDLRFTADLSHWYTGVELVYGDLDAKLDALGPVFDRVRAVHGRVGSPGCIQVDVTDGAHDGSVGHFHEMWTRCFAGFLRSEDRDGAIAFLPELLPPGNGYARTVRQPDGQRVEEGDRWAQAEALCTVATAAFAEARRRTGPADRTP